jgi:hypothetical protein
VIFPIRISIILIMLEGWPGLVSCTIAALRLHNKLLMEKLSVPSLCSYIFYDQPCALIQEDGFLVIWVVY